jgi:hypothetical protein
MSEGPQPVTWTTAATATKKDNPKKLRFIATLHISIFGPALGEVPHARFPRESASGGV